MSALTSGLLATRLVRCWVTCYTLGMLLGGPPLFGLYPNGLSPNGLSLNGLQGQLDYPQLDYL